MGVLICLGVQVNLNIFNFKTKTNKKNCDQKISKEDFAILDKVMTGFELAIKEALFIKREKPVLNIQLKDRAFALNLS